MALLWPLGQAEPADDLRVLEGDQRQVLNVLINQSRQLDQQRAKRLTGRSSLRTPLNSTWPSSGKLPRRPRPVPRENTAQRPSHRAAGRRQLLCGKGALREPPNHHVTGLLYLPEKGGGPPPGVLFACGHSANGKAHTAYQTACALMAQNGFVVLSYDPISQGERNSNRSHAGMARPHTPLNHGSRLVGRSIVWYWHGRCARDRLSAFPLRGRPSADRHDRHQRWRHADHIPHGAR